MNQGEDRKMDIEAKKQDSQNQQEIEYRESPARPQPLDLGNCLEKLDDYGGMRFIKSLIRETENLDPRRKALHDIFLSDPLYKDQRKELKETLSIWIDCLEKEFDDADGIAKHCMDQCHRVERNLSDNMFTVREEIKELEKTYRVLDSFFSNVGQEKTDCLHVMNVNKKSLLEMDSKSSKAVIKEISDKYDTLDLRESYSLLLIPGYLDSGVNIQDWAAIAHKNKAILITDFEDSLKYDDLLFRLEKSNLQSADRNNSSLIVACNYILARRKSELSTEDDDLYIPPSGAIAGRMCDTDNISIAQGVAGKKYGSLNKVPSVRFNLLKSELTKLIDMGVVPLVEIDGQVMAFSNRTPYDGPTIELQEYPIVRVFDWVSKVIQQFCNDEAFIIWDATIRSEMVENLQHFLSKYKGTGKLYENYSIKGVNKDATTGNILVQVELKPFFAAKNFLIELTGKTEKGKMTMTWEDNLI